jgi:hypothetical protein
MHALDCSLTLLSESAENVNSCNACKTFFYLFVRWTLKDSMARRHIKIDAVSPNLGDIGGGMRVNVSGRSFRDFGHTLCRFGGAPWIMPATVESPERMSCRTPSYPLERLQSSRRELTLEISLNGVDWTRSIPATTAFTYYNLGEVRISHLSPSAGPVLGGTRVTVVGHAFEGPGKRGVRGYLPESSSAALPRAPNAHCVFLRPNATCAEGFDCRADCARPGPCAMKVPATYVDRQTLTCLTPRAHLVANVTDLGALPAVDETFTLDVTFDDHSYTYGLNASWAYLNPASVGVSFVEPLGGPTAGDTAVLVLGGGFRRGGSAAFDSPASDTRDGTYCLFGADPYAHNGTVRVAATVVSPTRLICRSPPFEGHLAYHRRSVPVSVVLNGDDAAASPPCTHCNFSYYDERAARITAIETWGGPMDGGTWVRISGRVLANYRRTAGPLPSFEELIPYDGAWPDQRAKHVHQLQPNRSGAGGGLGSGGEGLAIWTPYDGPTGTGGSWVLQCRFGVAGHSDAVLTYETDHEWDDDAHQMRTANYTGALGWDAVPPGGTPGRPEPVVWCQAPPLRAEVAGNTSLYKGGHSQWVSLGLTLNGQQYLRSARGFFYFPRDTFVVDCARPGWCMAGEREERARRSYRGTLNATATGRACQPWNEQTPHAHTYTPAAFPDAGLGAHTYCRAPGGLRSGAPWCFTADPNVRWETCNVGAVVGEPEAMAAGAGGAAMGALLTAFEGVRVQALHPFGGPMEGGTSVTVIGRYFRRLSHAPMLCNFGNSTAEATPLGGPARALAAGAVEGALPWHVQATLLNSTHAVCVSPPLRNQSNGTAYVPVPVELSITGQLADRTASGVRFEYYAPPVLSVRWLYPAAGPKQGGTDVTVYGTGFKSLGLDILTLPSLDAGSASSQRGIKCLFGDLPMVDAEVVYPIGSDHPEDDR